MDRFAASVGFVLAGVGLAASFLEWTAPVAGYGVGSPWAALAAAVALLAFAVRRHGSSDRRLAGVAGVGFAALAVVATAALLLPAAAGRPEASIGLGVPAGLVVGVFGVATAYADWAGVERAAFVRKTRDAGIALGLGVFGLIFGYLLIIVFGSLVVGLLPPTLLNGFTTVVFAIGLGIVAVWFVQQRGVGFGYLDVKRPGRRGLLYVVGGVIVMFVLLYVLSAVSQLLGLPSTEHGLIQDARSNPELMLVFIPLSWLAIGPGEELLDRNVIQKYLYESFSRPAAVLIATFVFALIHAPAYATGGGPAALFVTLLRLFVVSLVLGVVYERTRNVVVAALLHGTYDAVQFALVYVMLTTNYL